MTLAPKGTPLWKTSSFNFAPRLGAAYVVRNSPRFETVLRGGGGVFFDTGRQAGSAGYTGPGLSALSLFGNYFGTSASFPAPLSQAGPPIVNPPVPPYSGNVYMFPSTLSTSIHTSMERKLGTSVGKFTGAHTFVRGVPRCKVVGAESDELVYRHFHASTQTLMKLCLSKMDSHRTTVRCKCSSSAG